VLQNIALGLPPTSLADLQPRVRELARRYGLEIAWARHTSDLAAGERQRIEILRALLSGPQVLILDEPTSVLTPQAVDRLFDTLRKLSSTGVSVIFISHKLHEVRRLATRCVVMRAGKPVAEVDPRLHSDASLAQLMLGEEPSIIAMHEAAVGEVALKVRNLNVHGINPTTFLHDVSFDVRSGEIVGIAGISGNGQQTLMAALSGERPAEPDTIRLFDQPVGALGTAERRRLGLRYVPEQRLGHAAVSNMTLAENVSLTDVASHATAVLNVPSAQAVTAQILERFRVRARADQKIETLSGGNLQKFIVGREVLFEPRVLLLDQPTSGVDALSAASIRNELIALRARGCAILMVSEEIDELYQLADRLIVIAGGRVSAPRMTRELTMAELGRLMAGPRATDETREGHAERVV
jgi:simple sugar transport system ATP-binding protein